jgi:N-methylhydantoinase B
MRMKGVDPITRQVIRNALRSAAGEMQISLIQTAHTPLIYEVKDFGVAMTDAKGELIAEGSALAGFLGCLPPTIRKGLEIFGKDGFSEGDVILANEPYDTGTHISDTALYMPLFHQRRLMGFACLMAHWADIGAFAPGGWCPSTTSIHQEGMIFSHIKLYDGGKLNRELHRFILKNVRAPMEVDGDLNAMIAACSTGSRRYQDLCSRYGTDVMEAALTEILDQSEVRMRAEIASIPPGVYRAEAFLDHDGINRGRRCRIAVAVTVAGDRISFDFSGSDPVAKGPVNHPLVGTKALCGTVLKSLMMPDDATNGGHLRVIEATAPANTIVSAEYPAPCDSYGYVAELVEYVVMRALAAAIPDRIPAPTYQMFAYHLVRTSRAHGKPFMCVEPVDGGGGAFPHDDGPNGIMFVGNGDASNTPVEILEASYPIRFEQYSLNLANRGIGKYRGGYGVVREFRLLEDDAELQTSTENNEQPLWGLAGGGDAGTSTVVIRRPGQKDVLLTDRVAEFGPLNAGAVIRIQTANGGGWGNPKERDPARIALDVRNGLIGLDEAIAQYGADRTAVENALRALKSAAT